MTRGALWLVNPNGRVPSFPVPLRPINSPTSPLSLPFYIFLFLLLRDSFLSPLKSLSLPSTPVIRIHLELFVGFM